MTTNADHSKSNDTMEIGRIAEHSKQLLFNRLLSFFSNEKVRQGKAFCYRYQAKDLALQIACSLWDIPNLFMFVRANRNLAMFYLLLRSYLRT